MRKAPKHSDASASPEADRVRPGRKGVISGPVRDGPFVIFALPRSRTAWLSRFLTYREWVCGHDEIQHLRSLDDITTWLSQPCVGSVETLAGPFWRLLDKLAPDARVVVIRRPVSEVVDSLMELPGVAFNRATLEMAMREYDRKLGQIEKRLECLSVDFHDLEREEVCARVFEYCLPHDHDPAWWRALAPINIQIDFRALARHVDAFRSSFEKLGSIARHRIMTDFALRRPVYSEGMTFQAESFDAWLKDAGHLLAEHHVQIGEAAENWRNKNIPLLRAIDAMGAMQITTARSNGRMFGYLMTLITPSLAAEGQMSAVNTAFFADPNCPGLGLKLQREALSSFRDRGIGEVLWETNTVGGGNRIASIYRRLGAEEKGAVYRLRLSEAA